MAKKVVLLGMGGTIAGTSASASDNVGYTAAQVAVAQLLESVPGLPARLGDCGLEAEQVCQIDSKDMDPAHWLALWTRAQAHLADAEVAAVVVTHGTDTLEETAYFLSRVLATELRHKPLVLTCAMRPASSLTPDGPGNMADAISVALSPGAAGVLVVCAGQVHGAAAVQKVHPYRVDAFDSGESAALGVVEEGRLRLLGAWPAAVPPLESAVLQRLRTLPWPRVELVYSHAGASGHLVRALLADSAADHALRGLVVAGTGNGTLHQALQAALLEAQACGVQVLRVSRCAYGQVVGADAGPFPAAPESPVKARIALQLALAAQP